MNKPNKAQFKRGNAYYCIVNNELKVYIEKWVDSCFSLEEFRSFDDVKMLSSKRRMLGMEISIYFFAFLLCFVPILVLAFEILVMK